MLQIILHILVKILAVLGIGILILSGLLLLLLCILLFVPVRYQAEFIKDTDTMLLTGKVSWLLHLVRVRIRYEKEAVIQAFVLFLRFMIPVSRRIKKKKKAKKKKKKKEQSKKEVSQTQEKVSKEEKPLTIAEKTQTAYEAKEENPKSFDSTSNSTANSTQDSTAKAKPSAKKERKNIFCKIKELCAKIKEGIANIRYYLELLKEEETSLAFSACKGSIFKVLKSLRPRKLEADLTIGTGSPDTTGYCMAVAGMLYPHFYRHVNIVPDFEKTIFEGRIFCKGKITLCVFLIQALRLYTNKDIRVLIKKLKREAA